MGSLDSPPLLSLAVVVDVSGRNYVAIGISRIIELNLKLASRFHQDGLIPDC